MTLQKTNRMNPSLFKALHLISEKSTTSTNPKWQSININTKNPMVEVFNVDLIFSDRNNLGEDQPWCEDHFLERVNGNPINPGDQYKNWPYYRELNDDELFRTDGTFSHNYMERYWCKGIKGKRYMYGDLKDIIERLKENPYTRQAYLSVWHPEDQGNHNVRVPCTLGYWFYMQGDKLNVKYLIRSCDAVRHLKNDVYLTYRLLEFVASEIGQDYGDLNMWIGNLHCFTSDLYCIKKCVESR